jgi:hypothetical protein
MIWRFFKHWGIYILITIVLIGGPYLLYRKGHNDGYRLALKENPSIHVGAGGIVNTYTNGNYKWAGVKIKLLWFNAGLGY